MRAWKAVLLTVFAIATVVVIGVVLMIHRGFRATNKPLPGEAAVARTMRDLAIAGKDRNRKKPLELTWQNLNDGREDFLAKCSGCHGRDGSGVAPTGQSLYPRVPDLRSPHTQDLSDGEIHYIIENGVACTGMPAWSNLHQTRDDDSWKLVLYIRSLRPLSRPEQAQEAQTMASAHYVGSHACAKCHAQIYEHWRKTPMANVVRDPRQHPDAIIPDLATNNVARFSKDQVAFVYGSIWKQRYFTKIGDDYFPLPVQCEIKNHKWSKYVVPRRGGDWWAAFYPPDNMHRPTGPLCDGCHSVGYDIHTKQVAEWNVGCERCHGPGSEHTSHTRKHC